MASREGGVEIEKVAAESPEKIIKEWISPVTGFRPFHANNIGYGLGLEPGPAGRIRPILSGLYKAFIEKDCLLAEINPLVLTKDREFVALDAKMNFDDNGLFRHKEIAALRDLNEESPLEIEASKHNLNYIKLNGNVGCMVNGAGLAMATMDIIKLSPADRSVANVPGATGAYPTKNPVAKNFIRKFFIKMITFQKKDICT